MSLRRRLFGLCCDFLFGRNRSCCHLGLFRLFSLAHRGYFFLLLLLLSLSLFGLICCLYLIFLDKLVTSEAFLGVCFFLIVLVIAIRRIRIISLDNLALRTHVRGLPVGPRLHPRWNVVGGGDSWHGLRRWLKRCLLHVCSNAIGDI